MDDQRNKDQSLRWNLWINGSDTLSLTIAQEQSLDGAYKTYSAKNFKRSAGRIVYGSLLRISTWSSPLFGQFGQPSLIKVNKLNLIIDWLRLLIDWLIDHRQLLRIQGDCGGSRTFFFDWFIILAKQTEIHKPPVFMVHGMLYNAYT